MVEETDVSVPEASSVSPLNNVDDVEDRLIVVGRLLGWGTTSLFVDVDAVAATAAAAVLLGSLDINAAACVKFSARICSSSLLEIDGCGCDMVVLYSSH